MLKDLLFLVSFYLTDRDRLTLKLYCLTIYFKFINDFKVCCINNNIISIKILSLINNKLNWFLGFYYACIGGHHDLVDFMINNYLLDVYWNLGLYGACRGGHRDLVDLMIHKDDDNWDDDNWDDGLYGACRGGHIDIVKLLIEKGATNWSKGLDGACRCGNIDIIELLIKNEADDWNSGLYGACRGGHIDIIKLMIEKGADDWNRGLSGACRRRSRHRGTTSPCDIVDLMILNGATKCSFCDRNHHLI